MTNNENTIKNVEDIDVMLEGLDETKISSILQKWKEINSVQKKLEQLEDMLRTKVKNYMKERQWTTYNDKETKINISVITQKNEKFDKVQLKLMLNDSQYAQVIKTTTFEKVMFSTPETRERLKKYVLGKK